MKSVYGVGSDSLVSHYLYVKRKMKILLLIILLAILNIVSCREDVLRPEDIDLPATHCIQIKWNPDVYQCTAGDSVWFWRP